jgi:hypothetical protein
MVYYYSYKYQTVTEISVFFYKNDTKQKYSNMSDYCYRK